MPSNPLPIPPGSPDSDPVPVPSLSISWPPLLPLPPICPHETPSLPPSHGVTPRAASPLICVHRRNGRRHQSGATISPPTRKQKTDCAHTWQEADALEGFGELLSVDSELFGELLGVNRPRRTLTVCLITPAALALEGLSTACACLRAGSRGSIVARWESGETGDAMEQGLMRCKRGCGGGCTTLNAGPGGRGMRN